MLKRFRPDEHGANEAPRQHRPSYLDIEHDGIVYRVAVKRVATARRFTLRVRAARHDVVLTIPAQGSFVAARVFATRQAEWIANRIGALAPAIQFTPDSEIPLRGRMHRAVGKPGLRRIGRVENSAEGPLLCVEGPAGQFAATLESFLRSEARADLSAAVARHAANAHTTAQGLTLRDTRSRWGSCTARGTLSFSWRLILAPPPVLDYLAAHEVSHLVHLDHSAAFWKLVRRLFPAIEEAEAWLKQHGASLHRYGAQAQPGITAGVGREPCAGTSDRPAGALP